MRKKPVNTGIPGQDGSYPHARLYPFIVIAAVSFAARYPLLMNRNLPNDYDHPAQSINTMKLERRYVPNRHPGSPLYEMGMGVLYHKVLAPLAGIAEWRDGSRYGADIVRNDSDQRIVTDSNFLIYLKLMSFACGLLILFLLYQDLSPVIGRLTASLIALTCSLHPVFLWMSVAWSEDIIALALGFLVLHLASRRKLEWALPVLAAIAVGIKFTAITFALATTILLAQRGLYAGRGDAWRLPIRFLSIAAMLSGLFYLAPFIYFKMDLVHLFDTPAYGTSPIQRVLIGIYMMRTVLLFWILFAVALVVGYSRLWIRGRRKILHAWDPALVLWVLISVVIVKRITPLTVALLLFGFFLAAWTVRLVWRETDRTTYQLLPHIFVVLLTMAMVCLAPFSRSFFLPMLPSLMILLAHRFPKKSFWVAALVLSYAPMFYYFNLDLSKPNGSIYRDGFYACLLDPQRTRWNDVNDFGYKNERTPIIQIGRS
jgi:hypothetical protein